METRDVRRWPIQFLMQSAFTCPAGQCRERGIVSSRRNGWAILVSIRRSQSQSPVSPKRNFLVVPADFGAGFQSAPGEVSFSIPKIRGYHLVGPGKSIRNSKRPPLQIRSRKRKGKEKSARSRDVGCNLYFMKVD